MITNVVTRLWRRDVSRGRVPRVTGDTFFVLFQPSSFSTVLTSVFIKGVTALRSVKKNYFIHSRSPSEASNHTFGSFDNTKKESSPLWSVAGAIDALCSNMLGQRSPRGSWKDGNIIT